MARLDAVRMASAALIALRIRKLATSTQRINQFRTNPTATRFSAVSVSPVSSPPPCPFCELPLERILVENIEGVVIRDSFPVSPGHTLVIPRRHIRSFFELNDEERPALLALLNEAKRKLDAEFQPAGYNIGINDGAAAGQTIGHLHIHLIPRFEGDQVDPRGGVRWIFPGKADYWTNRVPAGEA